MIIKPDVVKAGKVDDIIEQVYTIKTAIITLLIDGYLYIVEGERS